MTNRKQQRSPSINFTTLRAVCFAMAVLVSVATVIVCVKVSSVRRERAEIASLNAMDVFVHYDHAHAALPPDQLAWNGTSIGRIAFPNQQATQPAAPRWLRQILSDDYFQTATAVTLLTNDEQDIRRALPHLRKLPHLKEILLSSPSCGNALPTYWNAEKLLERELPHEKVTPIGGIPIVG